MASEGKTQNKQDKYRKPFIVLTIALVLIMLVYSLYYYSVAGKKEMTYLADVDSLAHTGLVLLQNEIEKTEGKNVVWPASLQTFLETGDPDTNRANVLHRQSITRIGKLSDGLEDRINEGLSRKFPNHPPIHLLKDEDTTRIYSYLFKKLTLPAVEMNTLTFAGKKVSFLEAWATEWDFIKVHDDTVLRIPINKREYLLLTNSTRWPPNTKHTGKWQKGTENILLHLPLMDFMLIKEYHLRTDFKDLTPPANPATQVVKFMLAPQTVDKKVYKEITDSTKTFTYNKPFIIALQGVEDERPYLIIKLENTHLLRK